MNSEMHKRLADIQDEMYQVQKNDNLSAYDKRQQLSKLRFERSQIDQAIKNQKTTL